MTLKSIWNKKQSARCIPNLNTGDFPVIYFITQEEQDQKNKQKTKMSEERNFKRKKKKVQKESSNK